MNKEDEFYNFIAGCLFFAFVITFVVGLFAREILHAIGSIFRFLVSL